MKKEKVITMTVLSIIIVITLFTVIGCSQKANPDNYTNVNLYFANTDKNDLKAESRLIEKNDDKEKFITGVIEELLKGPTEVSSSRIIPEKTRLISATLSDSTVSVDLSKSYLSDDGTDSILARYSLTNTLFEIGGVSSVKIFVEGKELTNSSGEPIGTISKSSVVSNVNETKSKSIMLTLYFSDDEAMYLLPEKRSVSLVDNSPEKTVITELIKGPSDNSHYPVIPQETRLISIETKEGICFVNFSSEFVTKHSGGSAGEAMTVYSIVNSLTELKNVDKVQFLVEGNKIDVYKHLEFNEPFPRDETWIKQ